MSVKIIATFKNVEEYISCAERGEVSVEELWDKHMIRPFWPEITKWAPFDQSFKKPPCVRDITSLDKQLSILSGIPFTNLESNFRNTTKALPLEDDGEPMSVFFYPACDSDKTLKEQQNGVVGAVVFGNIIIRINPLADDYQKWIPYVFAHEYHHNVWGYNHFVLHGGKHTDGSFLEYMITEGQADLFAESLFPQLIPRWNRPFDGDRETALWERIKPILSDTDPETHEAYMFGDENKGLPWCVGYSFGRMIVIDFMRKHRGLSFPELLEIPPRLIYEGSKFA